MAEPYKPEEVRECKICDAELPEGREDDNCVDCRAYRIIERRLRRGKVRVEQNVAEFTEKK